MATATNTPPLVDANRAAEILGIAVGTLSVWRCTQRYPLPYAKIGRAVRYNVADLEDFISSRTVTIPGRS